MFAVLFLSGHEFQGRVGDERVVTPGGEQLTLTGHDVFISHSPNDQLRP
jgi:hypothetical protein